MHDFESRGSALRAILRRAPQAFVLSAAVNAGWAQPAPAAASEPVPAAAAASDGRRVNINEYIVRGNTVLDARDIERAVYPYLGPDRTLADIESAREALQTVYQERGYQSVYVDLPEQQVADGIVFLQVAETKVGRVRVVGAQHYSPLAIRDEVPALQEGQVPNFNQAQAELTNLNKGASRQVVPLVKEGRMPGTMDVDLKVEDKSPWHASVGLNNDYSADTTRLRSTASLGYDNLWQLGHSVSLTFFTAPQETDNAKVWSGSYSMPLSSRWGLQFSGYKSDSNVATLGGTNVLGKGYSFGLSAIYTMEPQGDWSNSLSVGLDYKKFDESTRFGSNEDQIPIKYLPFTLAYNGYRYSESSQSSLGLSVVGASGSFFNQGSGWKEFDDKRYRANPSFALLRGDGTHTHNLFGDWQLGLRGSFQLASGALVSNEQFSAGGATSVRGYLAAERTGDDGLLGSVEWRTPSLARWLGSNVNEWRFYAFADAATLRLRDPLPEQDASYSLASVGLGTRLQVLDWLSGALDWGYPLKDGPNTRKHDPRLNFSVRASF
ncbi:ShlB/FhaC/HecB family hemolysin secretion/activation protein [Achromobacter sp. Bel]|uniref:ShlB/FhaC/HecB family hemolysin secretion/activation protein n=1 Tax=Achromobacter sp. Bel TaxID=2727415 RepID=UPI00145EDE0D|nr:ShlB/FhaC/HecB family hemolysin secretion/activation protein [Achromobacter sp. Bel]NMK50363.1 ShlB/FhaC/HecB family hemolysin secretion/activation protein [Achromobacter sp. Bel]